MRGCAIPAHLRKPGRGRSQHCNMPQATGRRQKQISSWLAPARLLGQSVIVEYLNAAVERVDHKDAVVVMDEQSGGTLELCASRAAVTKVIEKPSLLIEDLHHAPQSIDDVEVVFGIHGNALRPEH